MAHYYDKKTKVKDSIANKLLRILTTACVFSVMFILSMAMYHIVVGAFCNYFHLKAEFNFNGFIELESDYQYWSVKRITVIFLAGPLMCLITGIYFMYLFHSLMGTVNIIRYYLLWGGIAFINFFLVQLIASPFGAFDYKGGLYQGLSIVLAWWRFKGLMLAPIAIITAIGLFYFGYFSSNDFYKFSYSSRINVVKRAKNLFLLEVYFLPILISAPFLFLLSNRYSFILYVMTFLGFLIMGAGMIMKNEFNVMPEKASKEDVVNKIPLLEMLVAVGLWLFILLYWS